MKLSSVFSVALGLNLSLALVAFQPHQPHLNSKSVDNILSNAPSIRSLKAIYLNARASKGGESGGGSGDGSSDGERPSKIAKIGPPRDENGDINKEFLDQLTQNIHDPKMVAAIIDHFKELSSKPDGWTGKYGDDEEIKPGESGVKIKYDKDGVPHALIAYGDDMPFHAFGAKLQTMVFPNTVGKGYHAREKSLPRKYTINSLPTFTGKKVVRDEQPVASVQYKDGAYTVVMVPRGESTMQGMMVKAAKEACGDNGVIMDFDNRHKPNSKSLIAPILRGPKENPGLPFINYDPVETTPDYSDKSNEIYLVVVPEYLLPDVVKNHGKGNDGQDEDDGQDGDDGEGYYLRSKPDGENGGKKNTRSLKKSLGKRETDANLVVYAPFYNNYMHGDDLYVPFANKSSNSTARRNSARRSTVERDTIGDLQSQESNANDTSQLDMKAAVTNLITVRQFVQMKLTETLQPYTDAILNGSSNPLAEAQAWSLYSLISPGVYSSSPYFAGMDMFEDLSANMSTDPTSPQFDYGFKAYSASIGDFNSFVYNRAWLALNATGYLQYLEQLDEAIATVDRSLTPDSLWTVDSHATDPFLDYIMQWSEYNGTPVTASNSSNSSNNGTVELKTASWVLSELNLNSTAIAEAWNASTAAHNGTSVPRNSTAVTH